MRKHPKNCQKVNITVITCIVCDHCIYIIHNAHEMHRCTSGQVLRWLANNQYTVKCIIQNNYFTITVYKKVNLHSLISNDLGLRQLGKEFPVKAWTCCELGSASQSGYASFARLSQTARTYNREEHETFSIEKKKGTERVSKIIGDRINYWLMKNRKTRSRYKKIINHKLTILALLYQMCILFHSRAEFVYKPWIIVPNRSRLLYSHTPNL